QFIKEENGWQLETVDGGIYKEDTEGLQQYIKQCIDYPFNLAADYMLRASLISLEAEDHVLVVTLHHIASDGWSTSIIVKELVELYNAFIEKRTALLPQLLIQYADHALWQRKYLQGAALEKKLGYWKNKLEGVAALQLPTDYPRPSVQSTNGAITGFKLSKELTDQLQSLSRQEGTTLFMTLLAAFKVLLFRYSGQQDICVGTPIAGRQQQELEGLIGFFINTLTLRSQLVGDASFKDLLKQLRATTLEAYDHQDVPFEKVVEAVVKEREMSRSPLFQVMFVLQNTPDIEDLRLGDVKLSPGVAGLSPHNTSKFELTFNITESTTGLHLSVEYCTDLYNEQTIKRMMVHFNELLNSAVKAPEQSIGLLPMLTQPEERQLLFDFNDSMADYPEDKTIIDLFEEQAAKYPANIALVFEKEELTYKELNERANQLAHYLRIRGVKEDSLVPICIENSIEMLVGLIGILKAGGAYVPVDPDYPADRIHYMLEDTAAKIVVSNSESRLKLPSTENIDIIDMNSDWPAIAKGPSGNLQINIKPFDLAYVIYTSGSTGRPKGVLIEHRNVVRLFKTATPLYDFTEKDTWSMFHSFSFDFSVWEMYGALFYGGRLVIVPKYITKDIPLFGRLIIDQQVTILNQTPSAFYVLQDYLVDKVNTVPVRYVIFGGEALNPAKLQPWKELYPRSRLVNMYGITETTVHVTYQEIGWPQIRGGKSVIGKPIPTLTAYILDSHQNLLPIGVAGELCIGGAGLARGYLSRPALTAKRFISDPYSKKPGGRLYRSGDLGVWLPDGNIEYLGRMDEQVKIRGYRIELGEIETVLQDCPAVRQVVVLAKEDKEGAKRLVGYIIPRGSFEREVFVAYLKEKLPDNMVPALWVEMERFPLTDNGKINKQALPDPDISLVPANQYEAPRNELEARLAEIWQDLLGIETAGIHDNFFELGGHSLHVIRLVSLINKKMEVDISINEVFIFPTIASLVGNYIEKIKNPSLPAVNIKYLVPIKTGGNKIPLYIVAGGGGTALRFKKFAELMEADQPVYVLQPPIDNKALKEFPDNIEGIASKFIEEILIQNPDGPYALSGHCLGGIIAFEMARQFKARDKKIHLLAMFDTIIRKTVKLEPRTIKNLYHVPLAMRRSVSKFVLKVDFETFLLRKHTRQSILYKMDTIRTILSRIKRKKLSSNELEYVGLEIFDESSDIYVAACRSYKLLPYEGEIVLFYAKEHYFFLDKKKNVGFKKLYLDESTKNMWKQYAVAISIHEIQGEHSEIFNPVNGVEFAFTLQQFLNNTEN
ncbi:MAG: amino acid adenylation domain-containing protein, partial [Ferruginibacter sp.]|nr:amino acid adenylation domain-containing protein [Ferruginibacter sp.]